MTEQKQDWRVRFTLLEGSPSWEKFAGCVCMLEYAGLARIYQQDWKALVFDLFPAYNTLEAVDYKVWASNCAVAFREKFGTTEVLAVDFTQTGKPKFIK